MGCLLGQARKTSMMPSARTRTSSKTLQALGMNSSNRSLFHSMTTLHAVTYGNIRLREEMQKGDKDLLVGSL